VARNDPTISAIYVVARLRMKIRTLEDATDCENGRHIHCEGRLQNRCLELWDSGSRELDKHSDICI